MFCHTQREKKNTQLKHFKAGLNFLLKVARIFMANNNRNSNTHTHIHTLLAKK